MWRGCGWKGRLQPGTLEEGIAVYTSAERGLTVGRFEERGSRGEAPRRKRSGAFGLTWKEGYG